MKGLSKVKVWLEKNSFIQSKLIGDTNSEYYQMIGLPITIRLGDHLGKQVTISDKYINILPGNNCNFYVIVIDKTTKVVNYKELIRIIKSFITLYTVIPEYLKFKLDMKKEFQQRESALVSEINNLKESTNSLKIKLKERMNKFSQAIKKINNSIVVEINNLN